MGYGASEILVVWMALYGWGWLGRWARGKWMIESARKNREIPDRERSASTPHSSNADPLLNSGRRRRTFNVRQARAPKPKQACWKVCCTRLSTLQQFIYKAVCCLLRYCIQIGQWWVLMIAYILVLTIWDFQEIQKLHGVHLQFRWPLVSAPDELVGALGRYLYFSAFAFIALLLTYVICLFSILQQFLWHLGTKASNCTLFTTRSSVMVSLSRDVAIRVLLLPMVYSFLSAKNIADVWSCMTNRYSQGLMCSPHLTDEERKSLQLDVIRSNFSLADSYEAWALHGFGMLVAMILRPDLVKKIRLDVLKTFDEVMLIDVEAFVLTCVGTAFCRVVPCWSRWRLGINLESDVLQNMSGMISGANFVVSCVAIYNIWTVEHKFSDVKRMHSFKPTWKFYGIKFMVVIAFWIQIVTTCIPLVIKIDADLTLLVDASIRVYGMVVVALIQFIAWWPSVDWYKEIDEVENTEIQEAVKKTFEGGQASSSDIGIKHVPQGVQNFVMDLFQPQDSRLDPSKWSNVAAYMQELNEDQLWRALYRGSQIGWTVPMRTHAENLSSSGQPRGTMMDMKIEDQKDELIKFLEGLYPTE